MNIGSLHQVKKRFWLLFPTKETAATLRRHPAVAVAAGADNENAAWYAARFSRLYNCNVTWFSPESFVVFLEEDGKFKKVLTSEGLIGWICFVESYNEYFEEVKKNNPLTSP
jgi:hypothetical protein